MEALSVYLNSLEVNSSTGGGGDVQTEFVLAFLRYARLAFVLSTNDEIKRIAKRIFDGWFIQHFKRPSCSRINTASANPPVYN